MLSALLAVCQSATEALDIGQQTAVVEVGSQLWSFLNVKLVRKATDHFPEEHKILQKESSTEMSL